MSIALAQAAYAARGLADDARARPLEHIRWLPNQDRFLRSPSRRKLIRQGNQWGGKTWAALADVHYRCVGRHPYINVPKPPVEWWVMCASWQQSLAIQGKLWELVGHHLAPGTRFDPKNGFHANVPVAPYPNGSIVRFKTARQHGLDLSSATIDGALWDEPPRSRRLYEEVQKRTQKRNGTVLLSLTPVNAPCDWIKELAEAGALTDFHARMLIENMIPVGYSTPITLRDGTPQDQAWIDTIVAETWDPEVPVVCHGEWEVRIEGRVFSAFRSSGDGAHVTTERPRGEVELVLGFDHGTRVGKQVAILSAVDTSSTHDRIWVLDEVVQPDNTTTDDDALAVLEMLRRNRLKWPQLDRVYGDRAYIRGPVDRKSNNDLRDSIARELRMSSRALRPEIRTVKRGAGHGAGSVNTGIRYLHQAMVRPGHFHVDPRCVHLIEALDRWDYRDDDHKDKVDALRYSLDRHIFTMRRRGDRVRRLNFR